MTYDKKRITSTIILGIILTILIILTIIFLPTSLSALQEEASEQESAAGSIALIFVGVIGLVLIFFFQIAINVVSGICLIFSIKNRQSTLKPIRIISYVMDALFFAVNITTLVKIIIFLTQV